MSIDILGFDILPKDSIYGAWLMSFENAECDRKSLFCLHYSQGDWRFELLFIRII